MERFTKVVPVIPDLLAKITKVVGVGRLPESMATLLARFGRVRRTRLENSPGGRNVRQGKKRGDCVGKTKCGKGTKVMTMVDAGGIPLATMIDSASPAEVSLIEPLLDRRVLARLPAKLVYDRAADSDPLRERLKQRGIELVCPHRKNRKKPPTQDGRKLKAYKRRWPVERTNAWLQNFRRVLVRHEYHPENYLGFVQLACLLVTLRKLRPANSSLVA
jgi:transposase